jgi:hypothetical protein
MIRDPREQEDGRACEVCGDAAQFYVPILERQFIKDYPLCTDCYHDQVVKCAGCGLPLWAIDGPYCSAACTPDYVIKDLERAARGDINRDDPRRI